MPPEPEGHVDQRNQHRHFHQRADDSGKRHGRCQAEGDDGYGDSQLEIIAGGGESGGGGARVIRADEFAHPEADNKSARWR
jgi:hypothetical protein